jgi:glucuronokinase
MVIAGDMMFQDRKFDLNQLLNFRHSKPDGDLAMFYELASWEKVNTRGVVEVCPFSNRILKFLEKPNEGETKSRNASVVFYCFRASTLHFLNR